MSNLSKKNIQSTLHDIKHPQKGPRVPKFEEKIIEKPKFRTKSVAVGLILAVLISVSGYGLYVSGSTGKIADSVRNWGQYRNEDEVTLAVSSDLLFKLPGYFGNITDIIGAIRGVSGGVSDLNNRGLALLFSGSGGEEFLDILKRIRDSIAKLNNLGFDVGEQVSGLSLIGDENTKELLSDTKKLEDGLSAIISFLDVDGDRRVVLLFENHSEIRPSGGFVGSYADVTLDKGSVKNIKVDDIYTPDRNAKYKIVPPIQLQSITTGWGARDANWFFDFPTSAEKTLELLESSEIYIHDGVKFDGAISINANVVSDILSVVGPIYVPEHDVTLTSENFIFAVRDEVESAREENPKENPKQILGLIAPTIIDRMQNLSEEKKTELMIAMIGRAYNKDLKFYFRDGELQKFIEDTPFSGSVYALPETFNGDYLAVVNANVAGGKTDIFINQSVALESIITTGGILTNNLTITRHHSGDTSEEELYRKLNQNFIKIFTPQGATLNSAAGVTPKTVSPKINYDSEGYSVDSVLNEIEKTRSKIGFNVEKYIEFGKDVFSAWFSTPPGESRTLELVYKRDGIFVENGAKFEFVLEKQSGVGSSFSYAIHAPDGYIWRESGSGEYSYSTDSIPGRLVINLTLADDREGY